MNFSDYLKENGVDIVEHDMPDTNGEFNLEEELKDLTDTLSKANDSMAKARAKANVSVFLEMDKMLKEAGYEDKDERLRIIEIIF